MSNKLLIVGASILQMPAILKAKEMGLRVAVADFNPKAVGIPYADEYYDCSTIDKQGLLRAANDFCPDGIMTTATDMPMRAIAYVCRKLGLPSVSEACALKCTDKIEMIKAFAANGVAAPKFFEVNSKSDLVGIADALDYPVIMKPADSSGSRGVCLVESPAKLLEYYEYAYSDSRSGKVVVEEYMHGAEVSVETFVTDGAAHILQITDKQTSGAPHFVETGHSQPSMLGDAVQSTIKRLASDACAAVGLTQGPAHIEIMATPQGPKLIEMGARMGGDCITSHLVPLSCGIDMTRQTILYALGRAVDLRPSLHKASAIRFISAFPAEGNARIDAVEGLSAAEKVRFIKEIGFFKHVGDVVGAINSSGDRTGYVIAQADTVHEAFAACDEAAALIKIKLSAQKGDSI